MKRHKLAQAFGSSGFAGLLERAPAWNGVLVLTYHRIGDPSHSPLDWDLWSADVDMFDRQVRHVVDCADVIGVNDMEQVLRKRRGRHVLITFDDGYRDNYESAYHILRAHGVPATFFVTTGLLDKKAVSWWDEIAWMVRSSALTGLPENPWTIRPVPFDEPNRLCAIRRLLWTFKKLDGHETRRYLDYLAEATGSGRSPADLGTNLWLTWDMIREMHAHGMSFGAHSVSHPVLSSLSAAEQEREISDSVVRIQEELGRPVRAFSYPVGHPEAFNSTTRSILEKAGVQWAFSYYGGYQRFGQFDPLNIPRIAIESDMEFARFRSVLALPQLFAYVRVLP